jgi:hypothetical protein
MLLGGGRDVVRIGANDSIIQVESQNERKKNPKSVKAFTSS